MGSSFFGEFVAGSRRQVDGRKEVFISGEEESQAGIKLGDYNSKKYTSAHKCAHL